MLLHFRYVADSHQPCRMFPKTVVADLACRISITALLLLSACSTAGQKVKQNSATALIGIHNLGQSSHCDQMSSGLDV